MVYMGLMMGLINRLERIVHTPEERPAKRWPWSPEPAALPGIRA
jgi:hypothetical protein